MFTLAAAANGIARIARVIAKDQVLATRVLKMANSASHGALMEITTVNDAIVRMGTGPVRNVAVPARTNETN